MLAYSTLSASRASGKPRGRAQDTNTSIPPLTTFRSAMANMHGESRVCTLRVCSCAIFSPGRFFAATELKAMLAFIVLNYDMKFEGHGKRPGNVYWGPVVIPAPSTRILFRKRQVSV
ncbi:hypothetical protein GY45DRAFT_1328112 [Cubamyces sp. BRFM 1775]|nr:hypothetical protein GY45DRAFT_1328112 [Cubamyces sp. BRFM 1775]